MNKPRKKRSRPLRYETLESRKLLSATAGFHRRVLTITSDNATDIINFSQIDKTIFVAGLTDSWSARKVKKIVVDLNGGNDTVSLNSWANGGNTALAENITINGGSGSKLVHLADGHDVNFSGAGSELKVSRKGVTTLDGNSINFTNELQVSRRRRVLTITGTNGNDTLNLAQNDGWVGIIGTIHWYKAKKVKAVVVNLQDGNDSVSLDSLTNGGNEVLSKAVTINSGIGNKTVHFPGGNEVNFSGYGHQLSLATNGTVTLDGVVVEFDDPEPLPQPDPDPPPPSGWFAANIQDTALATLGDSLYADELISRDDMIALLNNVEDGNTVDSTEFADLRRIADNASLFSSDGYVQTLTNYIAYGTPANSKYQGSTLGNLASGSSSTHLDKLVNKWFLGLDRPAAGGTYRQFAGQLFVHNSGDTYTADYTDVKQGQVGDCYFVCALAETALRNNSTITSIFIVNGDGTYGVKFRGPGGQAYYVTVDSYLPTNGAGNLIYAGMGANYASSSNELWVPLAEKAYAQVNEFGWSRYGSDSGQNSYAALEGGYIGDALEHVTGQTTTYLFTSSGSSFNAFVSAWTGGELVGFASYSSPPNVVGSHAYAVVGYNSSNQTVTLFNPWGIQYGLTTLSWTQIQANFQYFEFTV